MKLFLFLAASVFAQDNVCQDNCEQRHEAELARCNGDQQCINHANDMFRRCLHDCENGGDGPPSCTDQCDHRLEEEMRHCGDDEDCKKRAQDHHAHCTENCENHEHDCEGHCHHQHEQEMDHCKDDDQQCKDRADHHLENCLGHCDGDQAPPTCDDCEERYANEVQRCGDNEQCIADAERRYRDCMGRCEEGLFKGEKPTCKEACAKYFAGAAKKECKKDDKECLMKFKKMAGTCMEKKCGKTFASKCEEQCKNQAKEEAKKMCKPDDSACHDKYKKQAAKCIEEKCK